MLGADEPVADGEHGGHRPVRHAGLGVDVLDVVVRRLARDHQPLRDLLAGHAPRHQPQHLDLAGAQPGRPAPAVPAAVPGRAQHGFDGGTVEAPGPDLGPEQDGHLAGRHRRPVRPAFSLGPVRVGDRQDPPGRRQRVPGHPARVAGAVQPLVMLDRHGRERRQLVRGAEHALAEIGVQPHPLELPEQRPGLGREQVYQRGVELGAPASPGDRDGGVHSVGPLEDHRHVGQVHQPGREQDLLALYPGRFALAVPALERLSHAGADRVAQAQPFHQRVGRPPVVLEHHVEVAAAVPQKSGARPHPAGQGPAAAEMAEHERRALHRLAEVDAPDRMLDRLVVAEPFRLLVRVDMAPHPGQQRRVVDDLPLGRRQPDPLG